MAGHRPAVDRVSRLGVPLVAAVVALGGVAAATADSGEPRSIEQERPGAPSPSEPPPGPGAEGSPDSGFDPLFDEGVQAELEQQAAPDPWQPFNRGVLAFNEVFDRFLLEPALRGYRLAVPKLGRSALYRAFRNLRSPAIFTNHVLQMRFGDAARTAGRFVLNSTLGVGGLIDAGARGAGWEHEHADFGQTLGRYGVPSGPYLVLPALGPSSVRDLIGAGADFALDPLAWVIGPQWWLPTGVGGAFAELESAHEQLEALRAESVEFYAALRSGFYQSRLAAIQRARERSLSTRQLVAWLGGAQEQRSVPASVSAPP